MGADIGMEVFHLVSWFKLGKQALSWCLKVGIQWQRLRKGEAGAVTLKYAWLRLVIVLPL